ncbi:FtsX-like permease family protein [Brevibacillus sp. SYP-B805]|uniref:ABC transporter permease n=1 Tax=Brevibacillus sp. SYP-B805 TaxID=1578199 RepID=UPI0013EBF80E|nr:ABC transporter permease [Brevibacillus sp. SYP-B805]NGQ94922.1 FtsX-like permease family protein [Brevibacillus sp. SYP-B805]
MNFWESVRVSLRSIQTNKLRSFLTMLGIIIGVSAVIAMVAIGEGASANVASQINGLGSNLLIVSPGQARQGQISLGAGSLNTLTLADAEAIAQNESVAGVAPSINGRAQLVWRNKNYSTSLEGTSESYLQVRNTDVQQGRFFNHLEVKERANVAVVGTEVVSNLFGDAGANPVGQTIQINKIPFEIIGVLQSKGSSGMTNNDDKVIIPVTTAMDRITGGKNVGTIYVSAVSAEQMALAQADVQATLRARHHLKPKDSDDFQIRSQTDILSTAQSVTSVMTALLSGIAAISLVVGGIGIMNIMLVSVTERTREIGIRKAIGATRWDIQRQFLIESVTLSLLGGIAGILVGIGGVLLIGKLAGLPTSISLPPMLYAFLSSMLVGVIFGVYPARKASQLKPIDALRYE